MSSFFKDPSLADEALDFLIETTEGALKEKVIAAKEILHKKLEREIIKEGNLKKSITDYGKELAENFQEIFPNSGSAIRFWGKITTDQWQPKYLERKLW